MARRLEWRQVFTLAETVAQVIDTGRKSGLVSIVMPFLNTRESFFLEAIDSIKDQTYEDWELILVDDGSEAALSNIAKGVARGQPDKIRYLEHEKHRNLGISASRNRGISVARGEYIAFLDADDVWDAQQLEEQVALLSVCPEAAMLYGNTVYWRSWGGDPDEAERDIHYPLGVRADRLVQPPNLLRLILQRRAISPCMTSIIVRRRVFDDNEAFEDEFRAHYEDQVFVAKVAANYPIYVADRYWGKYRQNPESVTADGSDTDIAREWRLRYLLWMSDYLANKRLEDKALWHSLKLEILMLQNRHIERLIRYLRRWRGRFMRALRTIQRA